MWVQGEIVFVEIILCVICGTGNVLRSNRATVLQPYNHLEYSYHPFQIVHPKPLSVTPKNELGGNFQYYALLPPPTTRNTEFTTISLVHQLLEVHGLNPLPAGVKFSDLIRAADHRYTTTTTRQPFLYLWNVTPVRPAFYPWTATPRPTPFSWVHTLTSERPLTLTTLPSSLVTPQPMTTQSYDEIIKYWVTSSRKISSAVTPKKGLLPPPTPLTSAISPISPAVLTTPLSNNLHGDITSARTIIDFIKPPNFNKKVLVFPELLTSTGKTTLSYNNDPTVTIISPPTEKIFETNQYDMTTPTSDKQTEHATISPALSTVTSMITIAEYTHLSSINATVKNLVTSQVTENRFLESTSVTGETTTERTIPLIFDSMENITTNLTNIENASNQPLTNSPSEDVNNQLTVIPTSISSVEAPTTNFTPNIAPPDEFSTENLTVESNSLSYRQNTDETTEIDTHENLTSFSTTDNFIGNFNNEIVDKEKFLSNFVTSATDKIDTSLSQDLNETFSVTTSADLNLITDTTESALTSTSSPSSTTLN